MAAGVERHREAPQPSTAGVGLLVAAERWIEQGASGRDGKPALERTTVEFYRELLVVLSRAGEDLDLAQVTLPDFESLRDRLIAETSSRGRAVRVWNSLVRPVVAYARRRGWTGFELPKHVTVHPAEREQDPDEVFETHTPEQMRRILDLSLSKRADKSTVVARSWGRFCPLLHLLVSTGIRSSELRGLPVGAVDLEARSIRIKQRADRHGDIGSPKSKHAYRTIALPDSVALLLKEWLEARGEAPEDALVFPGQDGTALARKYLDRSMWKPLQAEAGVPVLSLHSTRHFFASRMISGGANPLELQRTLGHHDPAFTMRVYGHLFGGEEAERRRRSLAQAIMV